eukprot:gnl/MRDRNA2_/MRDRNA2_182171_c0_seq1.p1 gnl/MRDRNA2_/MRDRNA2_182171_c0~~gnl/MRDRNA2_/MRDRNA2_182171_c0_seq1.p1  ORF type:complete len:284 (+),score=41.64 gnl/MRDRNA2_/MRDRNA2_182171_c0_seq1:37-852(+)
MSGLIWTRGRGQALLSHRHWSSSTIPAWQKELVIQHLWSQIKQAQDVEWFGDFPVHDEVAIAHALSRSEIWLHVYDLNKAACKVNDAILSKFQLGLFHCGVEVFGTEYSFGCTYPDDTTSGIRNFEPRQAGCTGNYIYRESVRLGRAKLTQREMADLVVKFSTVWTSDTYHLTRRNCLTFADEFSKAIGADVEIPLWVRNACEVSKNSSVLDFVVDGGMQIQKWWARNSVPQMTVFSCAECNTKKMRTNEPEIVIRNSHRLDPNEVQLEDR